jgi:hypothetical protein
MARCDTCFRKVPEGTQLPRSATPEDPLTLLLARLELVCPCCHRDHSWRRRPTDQDRRVWEEVLACEDALRTARKPG